MRLIRTLASIAAPARPAVVGGAQAAVERPANSGGGGGGSGNGNAGGNNLMMGVGSSSGRSSSNGGSNTTFVQCTSNGHCVDDGCSTATIQVSRHNADVSAADTPSTSWMVADPRSPAPGATQYFSWDMPINPTSEVLCGGIVYSDLHVAAASGDYGQNAGSQTIPHNAIVPGGCANNTLSPQERRLSS